jgi:hypothetical protein
MCYSISSTSKVQLQTAAVNPRCCSLEQHHSLNGAAALDQLCVVRELKPGINGCCKPKEVAVPGTDSDHIFGTSMLLLCEVNELHLH